MSVQTETPTAPKLGAFIKASQKAPKSTEPPPFDEKTFTTHIAMKLTENASFMAKTFANEVEIGRWLRVAQKALDGKFTKWVDDHFKNNFNMSARTAWNYMTKADNVKAYGENISTLTTVEHNALASKNTPSATKRAAKKAIEAGDMKKASEILDANKETKSPKSTATTNASPPKAPAPHAPKPEAEARSKIADTLRASLNPDALKALAAQCSAAGFHDFGAFIAGILPEAN